SPAVVVPAGTPGAARAGGARRRQQHQATFVGAPLDGTDLDRLQLHRTDGELALRIVVMHGARHHHAAGQREHGGGEGEAAHAHASMATAAEKVRKAAAVVSRMMRAMRPVSAPKRSASSETLLALGRADTSTITLSVNASSGSPAARAPVPSSHTS